MNPTRSSYVEYGTGNMLNIDAGTIKRKIDSNEYDDEIIQEVQPNGKRACSISNNSQQFATFGMPITPMGQESSYGFASSWPQSNQTPLLSNNSPSSNIPSTGYVAMQGYQTPESSQSSVAASPFESSSMDMDMESTSMHQDSSAMVDSASAPLNSSSSSMQHQSSGLLPSALPGQNGNNESNTEYVPVHGRSMEIPSYARVPLNEVRKYRDQRWSSCIYGADTRIGQGMMI